MTSIESFKEILKDCQVEVPEESLEVFRDLIDLQSDLILDEWLKSKQTACQGVE